MKTLRNEIVKFARRPRIDRRFVGAGADLFVFSERA